MKILLIISLILIAGALFYFLKPTPQSPAIVSTPAPTVQTENREDLASFAIYTHGTFRVFTSKMYHNKSAEIYIEGTNPNVILVKKPAATWEDFFNTLPMKLTNECLTTGTKETFCTGDSGTLKFYINEQKVENFVNQKIEDGDRSLITFGKESEEEIQKQMLTVPNPLP